MKMEKKTNSRIWIILRLCMVVLITVASGVPSPLRIDGESIEHLLEGGFDVESDSPVKALKRSVIQENKKGDTFTFDESANIDNFPLIQNRKAKRAAPPKKTLQLNNAVSDNIDDQFEQGEGEDYGVPQPEDDPILQSVAGKQQQLELSGKKEEEVIEEEEDEEELGAKTQEDMQELETFYNSAREQIMRTHKMRLDGEIIKGINGKEPVVNDNENLAV